MKYLIFLLFSILTLSCVYKNPEIQRSHVIRITSNFVDLDILTIIDVKCDNFEKYFSVYHTKVITDSNQINQILLLLNELKNAREEYSKKVDTRIKLELLYNNDSVEFICMDRFIVDRNNHIFINTDSLKYLLTN